MIVARHVTHDDLASAVDVMVEAFADDPWFRWLFPSEDLWPAAPAAWFDLVLGRAMRRGHTFRSGDGAGAVAWIPPGCHFPEPEEVTMAVSLLGEHIGDRAAAALGVIGQCGAMIPDEPRFHCVYVGVKPDAQGRGVGWALLAQALDVCDAETWPASLTSTNDANLALYRSLGFREIGAVDVPDAGFSLRPMWRDPGRA